MRRTITILGALVILVALAAARDDVPRDTLDDASLWRVPLGVPADELTAGDSLTMRKQVALGRRLFFDSILSIDRDRACASCHRPEEGFATAGERPAARKGGALPRDVPTLYNRAFGRSHMWDGRFAALEEQVLFPISNEDEMGLPIDDAVGRLRDDATYRGLFRDAFERDPDAEALAQALAGFVRRLLHGDTPVDRFREGKVFAMSSDERAGMWIFQSKAGCWRCHSGFNFTDERFHNTGVEVTDGAPVPGRMAITGDPADAGAFKTPTLRGLLETPPYFHDGSASTLREVLEHYDRGGEPNANLDAQLKPLNLSEREIDLLVAFLGALSRREAE